MFQLLRCDNIHIWQYFRKNKDTKVNSDTSNEIGDIFPTQHLILNHLSYVSIECQFQILYFWYSSKSYE